VSDTSPFGVYEQLIWELGSRDVRGVLMLGCTPELARFALPDGAVVVVVRHLAGDPDLLRGNLQRAIADHGHGRLQVIAAGGDEAGRDLLKSVRLRGFGVRLELFAIDEAGSLWTGPGAKAGRDLGSALDEVERKPGSLRLGPAEFDGWLQERATSAREAMGKIQAYQQQLASRQPWATWSLAVVIGVVFLLQQLWGGPTSISTLVRMGAVVGEGAEALDWWRPISSSFLHGSYMHVGGNLLVLVLIGGFLERMLGWARFLALWLVSVVGGSMAAIFFSDASVMIGASGGGWGLMCAAGLIAALPSGLVPPLLAARMKTSIGQVLLLNLLISFVPGISMAAHLGGGGAGAAWALLGVATFGMRPAAHATSGPTVEPMAGPVKLAGVLAAGVLLGALVFGGVQDQPWLSMADGPWTEHTLGVPGAAVSLPEAMGEPEEDTVLEGLIQYGWGNLRTGPYAVTVEVVPNQPKVLTTLKLFRQYRSLKEARLTEDLGDQVTRTGEAVETEAEDGMEFRLVERFTIAGGGRGIRHSRATPTAAISVMVMEAPGVDPIAERVIESLKTAR